MSERSCLGIPAPWDNISCKLTSRSISSSIFVDHFNSCPRQKAHRHRKEEFAGRGDREYRIGRHRRPISVCNSVRTKLMSPTVWRTVVLPYSSYTADPHFSSRVFRERRVPLSWKMRRTLGQQNLEGTYTPA